MAKISNKTRYPNQDTPKLTDFTILSDGDTKATKTVTLGGIGTLIGVFSSIDDTITSSTTYTNESLEGAGTVFPFVNGVDARSGGFYSSFDSDTGTITFTSAQTGNITVGYS